MHITHRFPLAALAVAVLGVAACGSSDPATSPAGTVPDLGTSSGTGDAGTADGRDTGTATSDEDAVLAYAGCMREQGIDMADPVIDADGTMSFPSGQAAFDLSSPEFAAAQVECGPLLADVDFGIEDDQVTEVKDAFLRFTDCLRGEGLDVGDFRFGGGAARRVVLGGGGEPLIELVAPAIEGLDPANPDHREAVDACEPTLSAGFASIPGIGGA